MPQRTWPARLASSARSASRPAYGSGLPDPEDYQVPGQGHWSGDRGPRLLSGSELGSIKLPDSEQPDSEQPDSEQPGSKVSGSKVESLLGGSRPQLRARAALLGMLAVFLGGALVSDWLHIGILTGLALLAGWLAGAWYTDRRDLPWIVAAPPMIFLFAVLAAEVITAQGSTGTAAAESVLAGTFLTLAGTAPWLFIAVIAAVAIAMSRGLRETVRTLRAQLRSDRPAPRRDAHQPGQTAL
ncbi:MAG: DUF6542 domain-containing protein [Streptosporangiaceae bacterium]